MGVIYLCRRVNSLCDVFSYATREFFLIQLCNPARILLFCVRIAEEGRATVLGEEIGGGGVAANLHGTELVELPAIEVCRSAGEHG